MVDIKWLIKWPEVVVVMVVTMVTMATCQKHFLPGCFGFTARQISFHQIFHLGCTVWDALLMGCPNL